jgi:hypothetical protein
MIAALLLDASFVWSVALDITSGLVVADCSVN